MYPRAEYRVKTDWCNSTATKCRSLIFKFLEFETVNGWKCDIFLKPKNVNSLKIKALTYKSVNTSKTESVNIFESVTDVILTKHLTLNGNFK